MSSEILDQLTVPVTSRDHVLGRFNSPATLLEYADFECPFCAAAHSLVKAVQETLGDQLRFVFRHFPLSNVHPHAEHAAEAAEAAGAQGRFWPMYDMLFENQKALSDRDLVQYAAALDLDQRRLISEVLGGAYTMRVREDFLSGMRSGVNGTPTFFINGRRYDGPRDLESVIAALTTSSGPG